MSSFLFTGPQFRKLSVNEQGIDPDLMISCFRQIEKHYADHDSDARAMRTIDMYCTLVHLATLNNGKLSKEVVNASFQKH